MRISRSRPEPIISSASKAAAAPRSRQRQNRSNDHLRAPPSRPERARRAAAYFHQRHQHRSLPDISASTAKRRMVRWSSVKTPALAYASARLCQKASMTLSSLNHIRQFIEQLIQSDGIIRTRIPVALYTALAIAALTPPGPAHRHLWPSSGRIWGRYHQENHLLFWDIRMDRHLIPRQS